MRKLLMIVLLLICQKAISQTYNNEWIDYTKTYYKFKIGATGLYRIPGGNLPAALASVSADQFQVWRNGKQVTLFTSVATGPLGSGYIEFWGEKNDGKPDAPLYFNAAFQLSDKLSLETDTAAYFLTVNTNTAANQRYASQANNVTGNVLPAQQYFMHTARQDFKQIINKGNALYLAPYYVYSSAYDEGEWWSSTEFRSAVQPSGSSAGAAASPLNYTFNNLKPFTAGPASSLRMSVAGSAPNTRNIAAQVNSNTIFTTPLSQFAASIMSGPVTTSTITDNTQVTVNSVFNTTIAADRAVVGFIELIYPRTWDFANQTSFTFSLPATAQIYIEITNFSAGAAAPVLYDLTNNRRYVADINVSGQYRFVLPADAARDFVLVSQANGINTINAGAFQSKNFINFSQSANQGDYLIISNSLLRTGGDPVEQYRQYRNSTAGGAYNAKIYDIEELTDQFAFGINKHPLSIKNFLLFTRNKFTPRPKLAYIIGHGVTYDEYYNHQGTPEGEKLNMVPTFGYPGSDIMLAADGIAPIPATPIGRLAAISTQEVLDYLAKIKEYELNLKTGTQTIAEKQWTKNVVHIAGGANAGEDAILKNALMSYQTVIEDSLYGGKVYEFNKYSSSASTVISDALLLSLLKNGTGLVTYFGHGSSTNLSYNLPAINTWNNTGKYPLFVMLGCNVGNIFSYDVSRFSGLITLSERYVLSPSMGGIGMLASSHFGTLGELDQYATNLYAAWGRTRYDQPVVNGIQQADQNITNIYGTNNYLIRLHLEQHQLHGDPAIKLSTYAKPDYVMEEPQVYLNPSFISVADTSFAVKAYIYNIGKAVGSSAATVGLQVRRQYPDGSTAVVYTKNIQPSIRNLDSVAFNLPIVPTRDKGQNKLIFTIDYNNQYDELSELNNSTEKQFFIFEDELRPVYPYNFAIINRNNAKLVASTADPLLSTKTYLMEMDTTEFFNSPAKISRTITSAGGVIEFDPGITYKDSTVYHWRVAIAPATGSPYWNTSSFVYLNGTSAGFNQSNFFQHTKSVQDRMYIDSTERAWKYRQAATNFFIKNRVYRPGANMGDDEFSIAINGLSNIYSACVGASVIFNVFDPVTLKPYYNQQPTPGIVPSGTAGGYMGSAGLCTNGRAFNFEFQYTDTVNRRKMRDFLDALPNGVLITARTINATPDTPPYVDVWKTDVAKYGAGNTLYDRLKSAGFADIDSFTFLRSWIFVYKKNSSSFVPQWKLSENEFDAISMSINVASPDTLGYVTSPKFGPAAAWQQVRWRGSSLETPSTDNITVKVIGIRNSGQEDVLYTLNNTQQDFDISSVSVATYPYLRLQLSSLDKENLTPYQLRWWRIFYTPVPEGGLAANLRFSFKDTLEVGEPLNLAIPFKNVSDVAFGNTIKVNMTVRDRNNQQTTLVTPRLKAIASGDTAMLTYQVSTQNLTGNNTLFVDVNPDNDQAENTHVNNFLYKTFYVKGDVFKPTMDVTFDGVRILNGDIVSAKPKIMVKLKDESKYLLLNDTSLLTITLKYPDGNIRRFKYGTDTLKFTPPAAGADNVATIDFTPTLTLDDEYELTIVGKDRSGNAAGNIEYRVTFKVFNTPMISNMFNYPNPFTTSTAFVFTLTGSVVPQNLKIQILTVTGKIVREITKDELGPINIGRNITDFKWDGTDQYGQKLANGVYLYRVVTNLNGNSLDKFPTYDQSGSKVNTDQYFNKGYGKMYLMR